MVYGYGIESLSQINLYSGVSKIFFDIRGGSPLIQLLDQGGTNHQLSWSNTVIAYDVMPAGQATWQHKWTK